MAAYNAASYIGAAIESVLEQDYNRWELLIVNDGSKDVTQKIISVYNDARIRTFDKEHGGVSSARNFALDHMRGELFCFLDADDLFTSDSLSSRVAFFQAHEEVGMLDGKVLVTGADITNVLRVYQPSLSGRVIQDFAILSAKAFCMPSAMVRKEEGICYRFDPLMTHCEDIWFFLGVHQQSKLSFAFVNNEILYYRRHKSSAMRDLRGLGRGYLAFYRHIKSNRILNSGQLRYLKYKISKIMFLSYLRNGMFKESILYLYAVTKY